MIIYFTGTGNSKYIADMLGDKLEDEITDSREYIKDYSGGSFSSQKPYVFVAPTYGWQLPRIFENFIRSSEFSGSSDAYFVMNCGSDIGMPEERIRQLCSDRGLNYRGVFEIIMPENYIAMFNVPDEAESDKIIEAANGEIDAAAEKIKINIDFDERTVHFSDKCKSGLVNKLFRRFAVRTTAFYADDRCTGCGMCESLCPLNNIRLSFIDNRPQWGRECTHCMACICRCPSEAIEYGKKSIGKRRYICKEYKHETGRTT